MLHKKLQSISFILTFIIPMLLIGCDSTKSDAGLGTLTVEMTDAPIDSAAAVNVAIERVEVNNQADSKGWVAISEPQETYNLLELVNGSTVVLGSEELETGIYNQIRLILAEDGHNIVIDGEQYDLQVPSGTQTGIKININTEIEENEEFTLLLDFDASRSVVQLGGTSQYLLQPVIRATNKAITGSIAGTINPADSQPIVYAIANSDTLASTIADTSNGYFKLVGLEEGVYDLSVEPRNDAFQDTLVEDLSVTVDETTDIGTVELNRN